MKHTLTFLTALLLAPLAALHAAEKAPNFIVDLAHSPTPIRVLSVSGAEGTKASSC